MYECFHCGLRTVGWCGDFTFEEFGYEGDGIIHICECMNCGVEIEYRIPILSEEDEDELSDW